MHGSFAHCMLVNHCLDLQVYLLNELQHVLVVCAQFEEGIREQCNILRHIRRLSALPLQQVPTTIRIRCARSPIGHSVAKVLFTQSGLFMAAHVAGLWPKYKHICRSNNDSTICADVDETWKCEADITSGHDAGSEASCLTCQGTGCASAHINKIFRTAQALENGT